MIKFNDLVTILVGKKQDKLTPGMVGRVVHDFNSDSYLVEFLDEEWHIIGLDLFNSRELRIANNEESEEYRKSHSKRAEFLMDQIQDSNKDSI